MDFEKATRKDIEKLTLNYSKVKRKYGVNLKEREEIVKKLTKEKRENPNALNQMLLFQYLRDEIKPMLDRFEKEDAEIVRQYFRYISEQKTIKAGVKLG
ncbi:MAG TPA: hypothetical protein VFM18_12895 [Methanosarcina sp.]|nr:hypothetical protein [Methanosarcina sp.]